VRRRELVLAAAAAALAKPAAAVAAAGDAEIVERLIVAEQEAAFAYARSATGFARHEQEHADALRSQLSALGRAGPEPPRDPSELAAPARRVAVGGTPRAEIELEGSLLAAYRRALVELSEPSILRTAATIAASHAQHHALLLRRPNWTRDIGPGGRG
jgi:hypothetical protein